MMITNLPINIISEEIYKWLDLNEAIKARRVAKIFKLAFEEAIRGRHVAIVANGITNIGLFANIFNGAKEITLYFPEGNNGLYKFAKFDRVNIFYNLGANGCEIKGNENIHVYYCIKCETCGAISCPDMPKFANMATFSDNVAIYDPDETRIRVRVQTLGEVTTNAYDPYYSLVGYSLHPNESTHGHMQAKLYHTNNNGTALGTNGPILTTGRIQCPPLGHDVSIGGNARYIRQYDTFGPSVAVSRPSCKIVYKCDKCIGQETKWPLTYSS
jgi:hypothetical protein